MTRQTLRLTEKHFDVPLTVFLQHVMYVKPMDDGATTLALVDGSSLDVQESCDEIFIRIYG